MKKEHNGHESWAAWNVALWLSNDEGLYRSARACLRKWDGDTAKAAHELQNELPDRTPDGARYSLRSIRLALEGFEA